MRVGFGIVTALLAGCQWLAGIDPTRPSDASAPVTDGARDEDAAIDAACAPGRCAAQPFFETDPGPYTVVALGSGGVAFGPWAPYQYTTPPTPGSSINQVWRIDVPGQPVLLSNTSYMLDGFLDRDAVVALGPLQVTRVPLDGSGAIVLANQTTAYFRCAHPYAGDLWMLARSDGIWRVPMDGSGAPVHVIPRGTYGSVALWVDASGVWWGEDAPAELWNANLDGSGAHAVTALPSIPGGMAKLGDDLYVASTTTFGSLFRLRAGALSIVTSKPAITTPARLLARDPYLYLADLAGYGRALGAIWRYDPRDESWVKLVTAIQPDFDVDDTWLWFSERVETDAALSTRRLSRVPR